MIGDLTDSEDVSIRRLDCDVAPLRCGEPEVAGEGSVNGDDGRTL
jgi:hypothetical protein